MSVRHYSQDPGEPGENSMRALPPHRMRTEGDLEECGAVPPPPRLMKREVEEFKAPSPLPPFDGREDSIPTGPTTSPIPASPPPPETRLESLFQSSLIYQSRDPRSTAKDRDLAGFYNARIVNIRSAITTGSFELCEVGESTAGQGKRLYFDSRFESGNLECVAEVAEGEFNLLLQNDINSRGHTQWFFFKIGNTTSDCTIKLNILNFIKPSSLFNLGMKVAVYSLKAHQSTGLGWTRAGEDIVYFRNGVKRKRKSGFSSYYTLSFRYRFKYTGDEVYFAYSCPYTYTRIQRLLGQLEADQTKNQKTLCSTLGGNHCDYLTITNPSSEEERRRKKGVLLTARTHPGETVGSWVMEGVIEFLTEDSAEARMLRDKFVFRVLPMLNPDGVVNGNYRCGLLGVDLNRRWLKPNKQIHPVESHWKQQAKLFAAKRQIDLICDLHGHSRKLGSFIYGCTVPGQPEQTRIFPYILSKVCKAFDYKSCTFGIHPSKEKTLRVALFRDLGVANIYTLETSFCGPVSSSVHFTTSDLKSIGRSLCISLLISHCDTPSLPPSLLITKDSAMHELLNSADLLHQGEEDDESGSDSSPSEDEIESEIMAQILPVKGKIKAKRPLKVLKRPRKGLFPSKSKSPTGKQLDQSGEIPTLDRSLDTIASIASPEVRYSASKTFDPLMRAYYNLKGKRVRDQITQTPVSFYLSYKLKHQSEGREEGQRTPMMINDKLLGGYSRIEASIGSAKKSLLEELSLDVSVKPLQTISPGHKRSLLMPQLPSSKPESSHLRELSFSFNSKLPLNPEPSLESRFQQITGLNATPKARIKQQRTMKRYIRN